MKDTEVDTDAPALVAGEAFTRAGAALALSGHKVFDEAHDRLNWYWFDWMNGVDEDAEGEG